MPSHFAADDADIRALLENHGAADLITATADGLLATFLPFIFDPAAHEQGALLGHVARNNDQWRRPAIGDAMVIVRGPDAYISPSWYASKAEHGRVVPTWDYVLAHVHGELVLHSEPDWLAAHVARLTSVHEGGRAEPWAVTDAPERFVAGQLRAIVGVEVRISRVEAKWKLSQNRPPADVDGVVAGLTADGATAVAAAVQAARRG